MFEVALPSAEEKGTFEFAHSSVKIKSALNKLSIFISRTYVIPVRWRSKAKKMQNL
jgi:hypothetical protein